MTMAYEPSLQEWTAVLQIELERLRQENIALRHQVHDLELALLTTAEHGDIIEGQLYETNTKLKTEIVERVKAQATLQALLQIITHQKQDLEIIVQTIMEHGDILDNQWHEKFNLALRLADLDGLTQIPNRRRFDQCYAQAWQEGIENRTSLALILCDIDDFKGYNDTYGHLAGDDCLRQIAKVLSHCVQRSTDLVARYGGEEFVILLPHTGLKGALCVARRMQSAIADLNLSHDASIVAPHVTLSIGAASITPSPSNPTHELLAVADQYLYLAKKRGKNQIAYAA